MSTSPGLKARLRERLRKVRAGRSLSILDRNTPIARTISRKDGPEPLRTRPPLPGATTLQVVRLPAPLPIRGDIVGLLMEDREGER